MTGIQFREVLYALGGKFIAPFDMPRNEERYCLSDLQAICYERFRLVPPSRWEALMGALIAAKGDITFLAGRTFGEANSVGDYSIDRLLAFQSRAERVVSDW